LVSSNRRKHAGMRRESGNGQRRGINLRHLLYPGALRTDISPVHIASTLLGPCFFRVFTRLSLGGNALELSDEDFVAGVVEALWEGVRLAGSKPMRDLSTTSPISASTLRNLRRPGNACGALCSTLIACPATSSHRPISWPGHRSSSWSGVPDKGG